MLYSVTDGYYCITLYCITKICEARTGYGKRVLTLIFVTLAELTVERALCDTNYGVEVEQR
jgi:hypothetical protein